jgi:hypothetical protein
VSRIVHPRRLATAHRGSSVGEDTRTRPKILVRPDVPTVTAQFGHKRYTLSRSSDLLFVPEDGGHWAGGD